MGYYVFSSEYNKLKNENGNLKEQLEKFIPRRRVRRAYKYLKKADNLEEIQKGIEYLGSILDGTNKIEILIKENK